jgi:hypothetical protein
MYAWLVQSLLCAGGSELRPSAANLAQRQVIDEMLQQLDTLSESFKGPWRLSVERGESCRKALTTELRRFKVDGDGSDSREYESRYPREYETMYGMATAAAEADADVRLVVWLGFCVEHGQKHLEALGARLTKQAAPLSHPEFDYFLGLLEVWTASSRLADCAVGLGQTLYTSGMSLKSVASYDYKLLKSEDRESAAMTETLEKLGVSVGGTKAERVALLVQSFTRAIVTADTVNAVFISCRPNDNE